MANTLLSFGAAATDLGLADQLAGETEEERKKRQQDEQQRRALGPLAAAGGLASRTLGLGSYGSSNAGRAVFGGY